MLAALMSRGWGGWMVAGGVDHGRWGQVAKSAMAAPFFLVANAGQLRPCDVYQTHFAAALEVTTLNSIILFYL